MQFRWLSFGAVIVALLCPGHARAMENWFDGVCNAVVQNWNTVGVGDKVCLNSLCAMSGGRFQYGTQSAHNKHQALPIQDYEELNIHQAACSGRRAELEVLLGRGVDRNQFDLGGATPLYRLVETCCSDGVVSEGHAACFALLLIDESDLTLQMNDGQTVKDLLQKQQPSCIDLLTTQLFQNQKTLLDMALTN